ncbi:MAG: hypothetical protein Tsb0021_13630 [Chlamydiales bacterium]
MITKLFSLNEHYNLIEEINTESKSKKKKYTKEVKDLNLFIVQQEEKAFREKIQNLENPSILNRKTPIKKFTPLHISVITGNIAAANALINAGSDVNALDYKNWTPLHHAALECNSMMIQILIHKGANTNAKTHFGATYNDLLTLMNPLPAYPNLIWKESDDIEYVISIDEFQKFTEATYGEELKVTQEKLFSFWNEAQCVQEKQEDYPFLTEIRNAYKFMKSTPQYYLARVKLDSEGNEIEDFCGLGIFATKQLKPKDIIGQYVGTVSVEESCNNYTLEGNIDAEKFRNATAMVNDGFPNTVMLPVFDEGYPRRNVFIAAEAIEKGEQICWNYGFHKVKIGPYIELRGKELREFLKENSWKYFFEIAIKPSSELKFEEFIILEKFRYVYSSPGVMFKLSLEGVIDLKILNLICEHHPQKIEQSIEELYIEMYKTIEETLNILKKLDEIFPSISNDYWKYLHGLPSKKKITEILDFSRQANKQISKNLEGINRSLESASTDTKPFLKRIYEKQLEVEVKKNLFDEFLKR